MRPPRAGSPSTSSPDDILFGYDPLFLRAWEQKRTFSDTVVPRADTKLALRILYRRPEPLGRGVWVLDASDNNNFTPRLHIPLRYPRPASKFEARVFGPFLVVRSRKPTGTIREFLLQTQAVQLVGQSLYLGDSDINLLTVERALGLRGLDAGGARALAALGRFFLERLLEARTRPRTPQAGAVVRRSNRSGAGRRAARRGRDGRRAPSTRAVHEGAQPFASLVLAVHETILRWSSARSAICSST